MGKMRRLLAAVLVASMLFGTNGVSYAAETITDGASQETTVEETTETVTEDAESVAPEQSDPSETVDAVTQINTEDSAQDDSEAVKEVADTESDADDKAAAEDNDAEISEATNSTEKVTFSEGKLEFNGEDYGKDYSVTLSYGADAEIPADAQLQVTEIEKDKDPEKYEAYLKEANAAVENSVTDARFFDIKIMVGDEEIQPKSAVKVNISYKEAIEVEEKAEVQAVHFDEEKDEPVPVEIETNDGDKVDEVEFKAETFSVYAVLYTVDFKFNDFAFSMPGEGSILLSDLAQELGFYAESETKEFSVQDVVNVTFSNSELVKTEKQESGDWMLTSLKAFSTEETLTIDMANDDQFVVDVTDAQDALDINVSLYDYDDETQLDFPDDFSGKDNSIYLYAWIGPSSQISEADEKALWMVKDITELKGKQGTFTTSINKLSSNAYWAGDGDTAYSELTSDQKSQLQVRIVPMNGNPKPFGELKNMSQDALDTLWNAYPNGYEMSKKHNAGVNADAGTCEIGYIKGTTREQIVTLKFATEEDQGNIDAGNYYLLLDATSKDGNNHYYHVVEVKADGSEQTVTLPMTGNWSNSQPFSANWENIKASVIIPKDGKTITPGGNQPSESDYTTVYLMGDYFYTYKGFKKTTDIEHHVESTSFNFELKKTSYDSAKTPDDILGDAAEFGIVADTYKQSGHTETNYAVKNLDDNANSDVCGSGTGSMPFYVSNIINNTLDIHLTSCPIDLYIPEDQDSKLHNHIQELKDSVFDGPDTPKEIKGLPKLTEYNLSHEEIERYVDSMISAGQQTSTEMAAKSFMRPILRANVKTIDTRQFPDGKTIYIDCTDAVGEIEKSGWIINKLPEQSIVFNIPGENVMIGEFTVNVYNESGVKIDESGSTTDDRDDGTSAKNRKVDEIVFNHIFFNAYEANTLDLNNASGLFLAPFADRVTQSNGAGWILASGTVDSSAEWHFYRHNRHYTAKGDFELAGQKKIVDKNKQEQDYSKFSSMTFSFELYKCDGQGKVAEDARPVQTLTAGKDGKFKFNKLKYTHTDVPEGGTKEFYYVIKEVVPEEDNDKGVTYDAADVYIKVKASDSSSGEISFVISKGSTFGDWTEVSDSGEGDDKVYQIGDFANTVEEEKGSLKIEKKVTGTTDKSKEFTFAITLTPPSGSTLAESYHAKLNGNATTDAVVTDGKATVTLKAGDYYEILDLPAGTQYTVTERAIPVGYTEGTHTGDQGTISKDLQTATMNNTYAASGKGQVKVQKVLEGRPWTTSDAFTFTISAADGTPMPAESRITITDEDADHTKSFGEIEFTKAGTYTYTVKETKGTLGGVSYDETEHTVTIKVKDKGNGELIAEEGSALIQTTQVTNTYAASGKGQVKVQKVLEGRPWTTTDEFEFTIERGKDAPADEPMPAESRITITDEDADHTKSFGEIEFTKAGTYTYTVKETKGTLGGVSYDETEHTVTIKVKDKGNGELIAEEGSALIQTEQITNTYAAAGKGEVKVQKVLNGRPWTTTDEFEFTIERGKDAPADEPMPAESRITITDEDADHTKSFGEIKFTKAGTYTYIVKETKGNIGGITYDEIEHKVTIKVKDKGNGELIAEEGSALIQTANSTNEYGVSGKGEVKVQKVLNGRPWTTTDEFEFTIERGKDAPADEPMPAESRITITDEDADHTKSFGEIKFTKAGTYTYTVKETKGTLGGVSYDETEHTVTIKVKDKGNGELIAEEGSALIQTEQITNTYAASGKGEVKVQKVLNGRPWTTTDEFEFTIERGKDAPADEPMPAESRITITDEDADHTKSFGEIKFTKAGTYTYIVKETKGTLGGVTYDETEHTVTIKVKDKGNGELIAEEGSALIQTEQITNTYAASGKGEVKVQKVLNGRPWTTTDEFEFTIERGKDAPADEPMPAESRITITDEDADHIKSFGEIGFTKAGTYTYVVKETKGTLGGVTYDETEHKVTIKVKDKGNGELIAEEDSALIQTEQIKNTYAAAGEIVLNAQKKLSGARKLDKDQFIFELIEVIDGEDGKTENVIDTKKNDEEGKVAFDAIGYTQDDIYEYDAATGQYKIKDKTSYEYKIQEVIPDDAVNADGTTYKEASEAEKKAGGFTKDGYTYDGAVHTITVELTDNGDGTIDAKVAGSETEPGDTGAVFTNAYDSDGTLKLDAEKTFKNGTLKGGEFTFELMDAAGKVQQSKKNDAAGNVSFDMITYKLADVEKAPFTYTVREVPGNRTDVKYDETVYTVTVELKDKGDGTLEVTKKIDNGGALKFVNEQLNVETSVTIGGVKVLKGRTLKKDEFKFVLADADGKWVAAATNDAEGNFTFKPVSYKLFDLKGEKAKVYTYSVWEVKGSESRITYDEKVYTVKVTVTDNGDGTMTAKADLAKSDIKFVNREEKKKKDNTKTGDEAPLGVLFGGLGIGAAGLAVLLEDRKRRNRNR